jgi:hypothetical protein
MFSSKGREGVRIYPHHVEAISIINFLRNKEEAQSFLGKNIFLRRFIPDFA